MHVYVKDFGEWSSVKSKIDSRNSRPPLFKEGEVWWMSIGINVGFEQDGKDKKFVRPVLIVRKFNKNLFIGVPMSTKLKEIPYYVKVTLHGRVVSALISQIRAFSSKRIENKLGELDTKDFLTIKRRIVKQIFLPLSPKGKSRG